MVKSYISNSLPERFIKSHQLLLYYNDVIVNLLKLADEHRLSGISIPLEEKESISFELSCDPIMWMLNSGYSEEAYKVTKSHIFFSLLTDFIYYMHESFSCSERGKVSVAFSTSRKPIKDTLFYLCWLLAEPKEFINILLYNEAGDYDITKLSTEFKKTIYRNSCERIANKKINYDPDLLFEIIYDRKSKISLCGAWDMSAHLVTTNKSYPTNKGNLNFIFSSEEIWGDFWELYYNKIPYIMDFMIEVTITIFEEILTPDNVTVLFNRSMRNFKFTFSTMDTLDERFPAHYSEILDEIIIHCNHCYNQIHVSEHIKNEILYDFLFTCPHCQCVERVGAYYILNNEVNSV